MKLQKTFSVGRNSALTLIEILVIVAVLIMLIALFIPRLKKAQLRADRIQCNNNLKQIGLAFRVWEGDNHDRYPMAVSETNGGTMECVVGLNAFRHFQVMSNELSTPWVLTCPSDRDTNHLLATTFDTLEHSDRVRFLNNSNLSFFVGVEANETNPQMILSGDGNITNATPVRNGLLSLTTNDPAGFTSELHNGVGNVTLADGSVQGVSMSGLRQAAANTSLATNLLQMPVTIP
jgi:prepilin-type processing-associated H-X9-DG protein